jgi:hypothetical protein
MTTTGQLTAPPRPLSWLAQATSAAGSLAYAIGVVFLIALVPILAINGIVAGVKFLARTFTG